MHDKILTQLNSNSNTPELITYPDKQLALLPNEIPETKLAYLAGIIDGEGCIHINSRDNGAFSYQISITSTDFLLLKWVQDLVGGKIYKPQKGKNNRLIFWQWHAHGLHGKTILEVILPFLIIKKEPASLFIKAINMSLNNNNRVRSPQFKRKLSNLLLQIQATHSGKGRKVRVEG